MTVNRRIRLRSIALFLGIAASPWLAPDVTGPTAAFAQAPAAEGSGEASEGRPFDGYFATGCLAGLAIFVVCKSARR